MTVKQKGILFTMAAAVIFGFTPILTRSAYDGGANGTTMTFLRAAIALPFLWGIVKRKGVPLRLTREELKGVLLAGIPGTGITAMLLYASYNYISVGMATTIHFIYPVLVTVSCTFLFKEKLGLWKLLALLAGSGGVLLFLEPGSSSAIGFLIALCSGVTYAFYVVYLDKSGLKTMYYFKLSFYLCVTMALTAGVSGLVSGSLTFRLTPTAWPFAVLVALLTSIGGLTLFQLGVGLAGATTAAILSTLEPITSVIFGVLLLGEHLSPLKAVGCLCILASVILITRADTVRKEK